MLGGQDLIILQKVICLDLNFLVLNPPYILFLLVILLVARPLVQGAIGNVSGGRATLAGAGAGAGGAALPDNVQALLANPDGSVMLPDGEVADDHIDVAQIEGQVKKYQFL